MGNYHLPNGRTINLVRWSLVGTYSGVLEGDKQNASRYLREDLPERAARILPPGRPLKVVDLHTVELPEWMCVAEFKSGSVHNPDLDFSSVLYVCWFIEDIAGSFDEIIEPILPKIDWEMFAEDYDSMIF